MILIYLLIIVLFAVLLFWTWNNTKSFEQITQRISFIIIGLIILAIITLILFNISKAGINYPNTDIIGEIRKIALLIFIPINGYLSLPHIASIKTEIDEKEDEKNVKRRIIILLIVFIIAIIIETKYLKGFQNGIIQIIMNKNVL